MVLDESVVQKCCEAFGRVGSSRGIVDRNALKQVVTEIGECGSDEEYFRLMQELEHDDHGHIELNDFLKAFQAYKATSEEMNSEEDTTDAWISLGGEADRRGDLNTETLRKVVKEDFGLTIDIDSLLLELDRDANGKIDYEEFASLFHG
eukprot:Filipodium_phascolosomae@DN5664_c0_g1_i1.p1